MDVSVAADIDTGLSVFRSGSSIQLDDHSIAQYFDQSKVVSGIVIAILLSSKLL